MGFSRCLKDAERDRMVLDARAANAWEGGEDRWIQSLGSLEQLAHLFIPPSHDVSVYCEDPCFCHLGAETTTKCTCLDLLPSRARLPQLLFERGRPPDYGSVLEHPRYG